MRRSNAERREPVKKNIDEQQQLAKFGMVEKGKDPTPGLWLNLFRSGNRRFSDQTSINLHREDQNADNFKNL